MSDFHPMPPPFVPGIQYSIPRQTRRPGVITTIGVMSIIVGSLTMLGTFIAGGYSMVLFGVARIAASAQASAVTPPPPITVAGAASNPTTAPDDASADSIEDDSDHGLSVAASKIIADGVHAFHRLDKTRRAEFENFLQQAGALGGFSADADGTLPDVKKTVLEDRTMPPVTPGALPTDVLVTAFGRIEIYDEGVAFMPSDGSAAMRTAIGTKGTTPIGAGMNPAASGALTATEAQSVIAMLQTNSPNVVNPAQIATLTKALQKPGQTLATTGTGPNQFVYAYTQPDGTTLVMFNGGQITFDATGKELSQTSNAAVFGSPMKSIKVNSTAFAAVIIESILSGVLAIYLVISGVFVLRQSPVGSKLHWIYVALKIPIAIIGAISLPTLWYGFINSMQVGMASGGATPMSTTGFMVFGIILGSLAIAYPIGLIFALSSRSAGGITILSSRRASGFPRIANLAHQLTPWLAFGRTPGSSTNSAPARLRSFQKPSPLRRQFGHPL